MSRVKQLRALMSENQCDAYLITDSDGHYTFYSLSQENRRLNWITECQAQCGLAIVTLNDGAFFQALPNYRLLAKLEVDGDVWTLTDDLFQWINSKKLSLKRIAYDPYLTPLFVTKQLSAFTSSLYPIRSSTNWIDIISKKATSRERPTLTPIWSLNELCFAGETSTKKLEKLRQIYLNNEQKKYTLVVTAMDEIAWLLNLRGNDMQCNPLFYSFAIVSCDRLWLFTDNPHEDLHYEIHPYGSFFAFLSTLKDTDVWLDERSSAAVLHYLSSAIVHVSRSPIQQMKEIKNSVELEGFRQCHFRDCAAVCQTFEWLEKNMKNDVLNVTEVDVAIYLENRQREQANFVSIAFDTISASATNTALIEYSPFAAKMKKIIDRDLYYLDAGANYLDGTTDMTRTIQFGKATEEQIKCYTLLLRAILLIETTKFPSDDNLNGFHIYSLLKSYLSTINDRNEHLSFGHGVSHGGGVIEGGVSISDSHSFSTLIPIRAGMVLTLEPGIYFEGKWGIRLENVYEVIEDDQRFIHFIPLTLLPYSRSLIDFNLLTIEEIVWLNSYHQRCLHYVDGGSWMKQQINLFH
ncbi:unnamed protein product [Rotaria magnacalcarata]|uniref:Xaa-Pro aminopeptidase n=1 Tax=Rotaria magnacalcarata TaxID=392030 RepID=A0A819VHT5_9BILA|nr:unnamed protein product [Rotaria magnacalcarata]CAF2100730.1 unnamed protein product [Rotaria magnacalcarata]CAF4109021.1 unnamed protein product [Rotaria magnacalcarata]CAF4179519.1 unnamed protein product [Rotaria magnacalcarata]